MRVGCIGAAFRSSAPGAPGALRRALRGSVSQGILQASEMPATVVRRPDAGSATACPGGGLRAARTEPAEAGR